MYGTFSLCKLRENKVFTVTNWNKLQESLFCFYILLLNLLFPFFLDSLAYQKNLTHMASY